MGVYPLLTDDTCHFLAVDFDNAEWREDARAFADSCDVLGVPVALEVSRSGNGAHAWIFFSARVSAPNTQASEDARAALAKQAQELGMGYERSDRRSCTDDTHSPRGTAASTRCPVGNQCNMPPDGTSI